VENKKGIQKGSVILDELESLYGNKKPFYVIFLCSDWRKNMKAKSFVIKINKYVLITILYLIYGFRNIESFAILTVIVVSSLIFGSDDPKSDVYGGDSNCGHHDCGHHGDGCD